ncbi:MAG: glycosyltransferase [Tetrasphaera sp.]|nr:glycosyltransferase [Tetrasphaera sp.]
MRVLGFGTYDSRRHPRVSILLIGLERLGAEVHELNAPLGFSTAERVAMAAHPVRLWRLAARLISRWGRLTAGRYAVGAPEVVVVGYLGQFDVLLARALFPRAVLVLDLLVLGSDTLIDRGQGSGGKVALSGLLDRSACAAADVIVVDTEASASLVAEHHRGKVVVAQVGAGDAWFAARRPAEEVPAEGGLRLIFVGAHTPLQGTPVIGAALALLHDELAAGRLRVTMVGSGQDLPACRAAAGAAADLPAIAWVDWIDPDDLPPVVAAHEVALGIFGTGPKALRVVPHKVFEGAAAGCAVLTSDTEPQRSSLGPGALFVPPGDPAALAAAVRALLADPAAVVTARRGAGARADTAYRPEWVAQPLADALARKVTR